MAAKISKTEADQAHAVFSEMLCAQFKGKERARLTGALRDRRAKRQSTALYSQFLDQGGKAGDWEGFKEWLASIDWVAVIKIIVPILLSLLIV